ncbi:alkyl/aryl-sulfatase [Sandaracinobacteroides hominis]|uniref:alkyl/aryl-sulfatase n=1 Tax=Sandaracinobacteroides hominis TaxID=2780086 RepID=UPI001F487A4C|nr:alkyl sulfatase dimerization domain-containing protein [Sandaracinobacteroides hominis]
MQRAALLAGMLAVIAAPGAALAQGANSATRAANAAAAAALPRDDGQDAEFAARGFLGTWPEKQIMRDDGTGPAWDFAVLDAVKGDAPDTVNPSLWRHSKLLAKHGLFQVAPRVYQVRGFDISVMTVIVGDTGYILVDPLTATETARAALTLVKQKLGDKPVKALIYTHSHGDHFGGALGVVSEADAAAGKVAILAPDGFLEHAVSENLIAGNAMGRRALYQFGSPLPFGPTGRISSGIGPALSTGTISLLPPNDVIKATGDARTLDGVRFVFQLTPNTEAPAEMNFFLPDFRILCLAENANVTMHNVLTPRGALVRDSKSWADYLTAALRLYGKDTDTMVTSHGWPRFGHEVVTDFISSHRDAYKYLHDQSVRLMNKGLTMDEVAEEIALPPVLANRWFNRGYYGTMNHNSKAVYQRYLGWYSANPAALNRHPPEALGKRYVEALGGPERVKALAANAAASGDHRWAATLLDNLVFSGQADSAAKAQLAESYRQMGFAAEGSLWRNMYLVAAQELEKGVTPAPPSVGGAAMARFIPTSMMLDLLAVRLVPERVPAQPFTLALVLPDAKERHFIRVGNGVLVHEAGVDDAADVTVTMSRGDFLRALGGVPGGNPPRIEGKRELLPVFLGLFETPKADFPIVTP